MSSTAVIVLKKVGKAISFSSSDVLAKTLSA
jgi:hypothetical protein